MRLLSALFLLISALLATAQSENPRTCRILFLQGPEDAPKTLHLFDGTSSLEVELPRMNFSPTYPISNTATTIALLPAPPADPEKIPNESPSAKLAESIRDFYLIVSPDPSNKITPVRLQIIDASPGKFKNGQMLWFNLTPYAVGGTLGKQQLALAANSRTILDAPANTAEDYDVNLAFRIPENPHLHPLCETRWLHDPRSRSVYFIFNNPGVRTPRILGFPDFRQTETPGD
jgi:hypothetical protein